MRNNMPSLDSLLERIFISFHFLSFVLNYFSQGSSNKKRKPKKHFSFHFISWSVQGITFYSFTVRSVCGGNRNKEWERTEKKIFRVHLTVFFVSFKICTLLICFHKLADNSFVDKYVVKYILTQTSNLKIVSIVSNLQPYPAVHGRHVFSFKLSMFWLHVCLRRSSSAVVDGFEDKTSLYSGSCCWRGD